MKIFEIKLDVIILAIITVFLISDSVDLYFIFSTEGFSEMWNSQKFATFLGWFYGWCATGQILILEDKLKDATSH